MIARYDARGNVYAVAAPAQVREHGVPLPANAADAARSRLSWARPAVGAKGSAVRPVPNGGTIVAQLAELDPSWCRGVVVRIGNLHRATVLPGVAKLPPIVAVWQRAGQPSREKLVVIRPCHLDDREWLVEQFLDLNRYENPLAGSRQMDQQGAEEVLAATLQHVS